MNYISIDVGLTIIVGDTKLFPSGYTSKGIPPDFASNFQVGNKVGETLCVNNTAETANGLMPTPQTRHRCLRERSKSWTKLWYQ